MNRPLTVRLEQDPETLNPVTFKFTTTRQIFDLVYQPLYAITLPDGVIKPIIANSISDLIETDSGFFLNVQIREDAQWNSHYSITSFDIAFTLKLLNVPGGREIGINNQTNIIENFTITSPKSITFKFRNNVAEPHLIFDEFYIYPEDFFDPKKTLRGFSLNEIRTNKNPELTYELIEKLKTLNYLENKDLIIGSNAYKIISWKVGERITLIKKEHYWFEHYENPEFQAIPDTIIFQVIPNSNSALVALENHQIDIVSNLSPNDIYLLKEKYNNDEEYRFEETETYDLTFFGSNAKKAPFNDINFRKGLAWIIPYKSIIKHSIHDLGVPTVGFTFPHQKLYYNHSIIPRSLNYDSAKFYFARAGWKIVNGQLMNLKNQKAEFYLMYRKSIKDHEITAFLIQDAFQKAGITINLQPMESHLMSDQFNQLNFDLFIKRLSGGATAFNYEFILHSNFSPPNGWNFSSFGTKESDSLIFAIRDAFSENERIKPLLRFQEIMHDQCNVIPLYNEKKVIVVNNKYENLNISSLTPGYTIATIKVKEN